jgi:hypothetical protein
LLILDKVYRDNQSLEHALTKKLHGEITNVIVLSVDYPHQRTHVDVRFRPHPYPRPHPHRDRPAVAVPAADVSEVVEPDVPFHSAPVDGAFAMDIEPDDAGLVAEPEWVDDDDPPEEVPQ